MSRILSALVQCTKQSLGYLCFGSVDEILGDGRNEETEEGGGKWIRERVEKKRIRYKIKRTRECIWDGRGKGRDEIG